MDAPSAVDHGGDGERLVQLVEGRAGVKRGDRMRSGGLAAAGDKKGEGDQMRSGRVERSRRKGVCTEAFR